MSHHSYSVDSTARDAAGEQPFTQGDAPTLRQCAYNQTRGRFLSADVDAGDFSGSSLDARLASITPDSGMGLCLAPFRAIAPTSVRVPVDLIYLDRGSMVIGVAESFPLARAVASSASAASVLVLPAETIRSTETRAGDQLLLCAPEEMKRRLQKPAEPATEVSQEEQARAAGTGRVLQWEDRTRRSSDRPAVELATARPLEHPAEPLRERAVEESASRSPERSLERSLDPSRDSSLDTRLKQQVAEAPVQETAALAVQAGSAIAAGEAAALAAKSSKSWLQKLLGLEPPDARRTKRESLPGLSAYFFTGGNPVAHGVRDISLTGMYVLTSERWYPGTMVRMTLTDRHEPTMERSITLHATVMRSGDDGVGMRFVLQNPKDRRGRHPDGTTEATDMDQVQRFLEKLRGAGL
jgi:uncharacterized membrane protein (UPF0127 family)